MSPQERAFIDRASYLGAIVTIKQNVICTTVGSLTNTQSRASIYECSVEDARLGGEATVANLVAALNSGELQPDLSILTAEGRAEYERTGVMPSTSAAQA